MPSNTKDQPILFFIFGGTGDLNWRKITPALYNLFLDDWLPDRFAIIGTARTPLAEDAFRSKLRKGINQFSRKGKTKDNEWTDFSSHISYQVSDLNDEMNTPNLERRSSITLKNGSRNHV